MRDSSKVIIVILVCTILILSSVYLIILSGTGCSKIIPTVVEGGEEYNENNNGSGNNNDGNETNGGNEEFAHTVFIEEGTATWCVYCPNIAGILHELYVSGNYNFYYISMIQDMSTKANDRLYNDYNILGFPTIFIDGGYSVISGGGEGKSVVEKAIHKAESRKVPNVGVTVKAKYNNDTNEIITDILIENNEINEYKGNLKVYLTEIISRWVNPYKAEDGETKPYHFGFVDYITDKDITVDGKSNITISERKKLTDFAVPDLAPEELMIFGVVFNSKSVKTYAFPPDENPFNAYYADATNATILIQGGNLPPTVGISLPEAGMLHLLGKPILKTLQKRTILIGKTSIVAVAQDDVGVEKVEFYIDDQLVNTDNQAPYEYSFDKIGDSVKIIRKHVIKLVAYDAEGKTGTVELEVLAFFL